MAFQRLSVRRDARAFMHAMLFQTRNDLHCACCNKHLCPHCIMLQFAALHSVALLLSSRPTAQRCSERCHMLHCTIIGGLPNLCKDGLTGFLFEPKDTDGFAVRWTHILRYLLNASAVQHCTML